MTKRARRRFTRIKAAWRHAWGSLHRWIAACARSPWFPLLVAALAAADAYVFVVPTEALIVAAVLGRRERWFLTGFWVTLGSAFGAVSVAWLAMVYGTQFVEWLAPGLMRDEAWTAARNYLSRNGWWGLALVSLSPLPQHAAVVAAGLARMNLVVVFWAVFFGRVVKYEAVAWAVVYAPRALKTMHIGHWSGPGRDTR